MSFVVFLKVLFLNSYPDFSSYYYGSTALLHNRNPYLGGKDFFAPFIYPPFSLLFFLPFTLMPFLIAGKAFTIISLLCILLSIYMLYKLFKLSVFGYLGLIVLILVFNYFPEKFTLGMGQINNVILLLVVFWMYFYVKKRDYLSGIFLAFALSLKLFPVLIILLLIIERRWKTLFSTIIALLILALTVALTINERINVYFLKTFFSGTLTSSKVDYYNQALSGLITRGIQNPALQHILITGISTILLIFSLIYIWKFIRKTKYSSLLSIGILISLSLIINPFSWQHHFVWLLIPFSISLSYIKTYHLHWRYYLLLGISFLLVAFNLKNPSVVPVLIQSHVLFGAILLYCLEVHLLRREIK